MVVSKPVEIGCEISEAGSLDAAYPSIDSLHYDLVFGMPTYGGRDPAKVNRILSGTASLPPAAGSLALTREAAPPMC